MLWYFSLKPLLPPFFSLISLLFLSTFFNFPVFVLWILHFSGISWSGFCQFWSVMVRKHLKSNLVWEMSSLCRRIQDMEATFWWSKKNRFLLAVYGIQNYFLWILDRVLDTEFGQPVCAPWFGCLWTIALRLTVVFGIIFSLRTFWAFLFGTCCGLAKWVESSMGLKGEWLQSQGLIARII